jgi:hypothetical protein
MEKKTLFALIAVAILGAGAFAVLRAPQKGQRVGPPPRPVAEIKAADIAHLELVSEKQDKVVLDKKGDKWSITSPKEWAADGAGVKSLVDGLEKLGFHDMVTEAQAKHEEFGVADGKAQRVTVKNATGTLLADFFVGKAVSGYTMVRPAGKNEVWQANGIYAYMINRDAKGWRDHAIFEFAAVDGDKLTVDGSGGKLAVEKLPPEKDAKGDVKWKVVEGTGEAPKTSEALDLAQVNGAVQAVSTLRAADFADDKKPEDVGLAKPALTLTASAKGKSYTLLVGNTVGEDVYLKTAESPTIYTVKKFTAERLAHAPIDYRDKTLTKIKDIDLASIDLTVGAESLSLEHAGDKWKAKGKASVDDGKLKPVVSAFENLSGSGFAPSKEPAATGLGKPSGTVALHLKDQSTVTLKIGALTKDGADYFVQKVGSPDVLLLKKYNVERFLKKASDLAPAATAATAKPGASPKPAATAKK